MQVRLLGEVELDAKGRSRSAARISGACSPPWRSAGVRSCRCRGSSTFSGPSRDPPSHAERNVRTYVHRLRTALAEDGVRVETVGTGYRLRLDVEELDVAHFECLADIAVRAAETGDPVGALDHVHQAEQLWRGRPLGAFDASRGRCRPWPASSSDGRTYVSVARRR